MPGWIKLWRKTIDHGHFHMPDICFKLWVYCLLKASPFSTPELAAGELCLSYREIQENLGQWGKTISKSTIAAALRYLHEHSYLVVEAVPLQGIRVKVLNWQRYQAGDEQHQNLDQQTPASGQEERTGTNPGGEEGDLTPALPAAESPGTAAVPARSSPGTPTVPAEDPSGAPAVPDWYSGSTSAGTARVPITACEASKDAGYRTPKNILKNTKELSGINTPQTPLNPKKGETGTTKDILTQFPRYSTRQTDLIRDYWQMIGRTRKTRTISPSIIAKQMTYWERFPVEIVMEALTIHLQKHRDKREAYTAGIMRRLARERVGINTTGGGSTDGSVGQDIGTDALGRPRSRYAHLVQ